MIRAMSGTQALLKWKMFIYEALKITSRLKIRENKMSVPCTVELNCFHFEIFYTVRGT